MADSKDKFQGNADELRKIINENIWFRAENKEIALEFLDALIENHESAIEDADDDLDNSPRIDVFDELEENFSEFEPDEEEYWELDYGLGELRIINDPINLLFQTKLEAFVEDFKNNNQ